MGQYCCCLHKQDDSDRGNRAMKKIKKRRKVFDSGRIAKVSKADFEKVGGIDSGSDRKIRSAVMSPKVREQKTASTQTDEMLILSYIKQKRDHFLHLRELFEPQTPSYGDNFKPFHQKNSRREENVQTIEVFQKAIKVKTNSKKLKTLNFLKNGDETIKMSRRINKSFESLSSSSGQIYGPSSPVDKRKIGFTSFQKKRRTIPNSDGNINHSLILSNGRKLKKKYYEKTRNSIFGNLGVIQLQSVQIPQNEDSKKYNSNFSNLNDIKERDEKSYDSNLSLQRKTRSMGKEKKRTLKNLKKSKFEKRKFSLGKNDRKNIQRLKIPGLNQRRHAKSNFKLRVQKVNKIDKDMLKKIHQTKTLKRHSVFNDNLLKKFYEMNKKDQNKILLAHGYNNKHHRKDSGHSDSSSSVSSSDSSLVLRDLIRDREEKEMNDERKSRAEKRSLTIKMQMEA